METSSHKKDYLKVIDVLDSCDTYEQIEAAKRYFDIYMFRWRHMLNSASVDELKHDFSTRIEIKEGEIR